MVNMCALIEVIFEGCIPTDWQDSYIDSLYNCKGDYMNRRKYRSMGACCSIEPVMKVLKRLMK